jgi:outer membrane immunogenic protein
MKGFSLLATAIISCMAATHVSASSLVYNELNLPPEPFMGLDCPVFSTISEGVYIGANVGYDSYRVGQSIQALDTSGIFAVSRRSSNLYGPLVGVLAGYGRFFNWFYLAGEVFANSSGADGNFQFGTYQSNLQLRYSVGATIRPGILVNHMGLVFLRLGIVRSLVGFSEKGLNIESPDNSATEFVNGLSVGVGLETAMTSHLNLRLDVSHTQYGSFESIRDTQYEPSDTQATVSVVYHFDIV